MKAKLLTLLLLLVPVISSCGGGNIEIEGKVQYIDYLNYKCWFIIDKETGFHYELITTDEFLLQEGLRVKISAKTAETATICNVGDKVNVLGYKVTGRLENGMPVIRK